MFQRTTMESPMDDKFFNIPRELADDFIAGKKELKEQGLAQQKARMCIMLDISLSMQTDHKFFLDKQSNKVQQAINRILALSFSLDDNQQIDIFPFGEVAHDVISINRSNYKQATDIVLKALANTKDDLPPHELFQYLEEKTNYAAAIRKVRHHYFNDCSVRQKIQADNELPVFAILLTDGEHNMEIEEAENQFKFASYQNIFIKSIGLVGKEMSEEKINEHFKFLTDMDNAKSPNKKENSSNYSLWSFLCCATDINYEFCIDNSDFVAVVDPSKISIQQLINEFRGWLIEAHKVGISKRPPKLDESVKMESEGRISLR